ncbi:MAG: TonB-dependent receptor, partial [Bacteroidales bacterium]|nr:TonB-dependent receptor [Bacteroidales bacterium]
MITNKYLITILLIAFFSVGLFAQKYTISGYVKDHSTGEDMIGANVYIKEISKGTVSNQYGFYSITVPKGEYIITVSYIGYIDFSKKITLDKNIRLNIQSKPNLIVAKEVVISSERTINIESTQMGAVRLPVEKIKVLPAFMGEVDIIKTIQLLPGVQSGGEGNTGFYVRGGGPDQNLILLDEAVVYNAAHLFGFFSVFNADAVKDINLIKGGMPAQYGGRLSSVLDITMKDGNYKEYKAEGGIGIISSRLTVQGPIKKDTSSFIASGRRTYIDVLMEPFIKEDAKAKGSGYYFYDLNAKVNYKFSDKDRLFLSGYFGRDVFSLNNKDAGFGANIAWGNATGSLRWNHLFSNKFLMNATLIMSDYEFEFGAEQDNFEFKLFSGIRDYNAKIDFTYYPTVRHNVKFGINYIYHIFQPSSVTAKIGETSFDTGGIIKNYANDVAIYVNDDFDLTDKLKISAGLRGTLFQQIGPFDRYVDNELGQAADTVHYDRGENVELYKHIEPRFSMRYSLGMKSSVKASYTQNYQYIHLASSTSASLPTDLWVPSSSLVKPQFGTQYAVGYFRNFNDNIFETSIEVYYKDFQNQISYKDGAQPGDDVGQNADNSFVFGSGESYGVELFIKKRLGKTTGWIGYT